VNLFWFTGHALISTFRYKPSLEWAKLSWFGVQLFNLPVRFFCSSGRYWTTSPKEGALKTIISMKG